MHEIAHNADLLLMIGDPVAEPLELPRADDVHGCVEASRVRRRFGRGEAKGQAVMLTVDRMTRLVAIGGRGSGSGVPDAVRNCVQMTQRTMTLSMMMLCVASRWKK